MSDRLNITLQLASFLVAVAALIVTAAAAPHSIKRAKGWTFDLLVTAKGKVRNGAVCIWREHRTALVTTVTIALILGAIIPLFFSNEDFPSSNIDYSRLILIQTA